MIMFYAHFVLGNSKFGLMLLVKLKLFAGKVLSVYKLFSDFHLLIAECNRDDNLGLEWCVFRGEGLILECFVSVFQ